VAFFARHLFDIISVVEMFFGWDPFCVIDIVALLQIQ
jgi:hypothetical protein